MAIFDIFESSMQRKKRIEGELRKTTRVAERSIGEIENNLATLKGERAKCWQEAKTLLQAGQKDDAAMALQSYKYAVVNANKSHKLLMVMRSRFAALKNASAINDITTALTSMASALNLSADDIVGKLDDIDMTMDEIIGMEQVISDTAMRDVKDLDKQLANSGAATSADDYLWNKLEQEALGGIAASGGALQSDGKESAGTISESRAALNALLK